MGLLRVGQRGLVDDDVAVDIAPNRNTALAGSNPTACCGCAGAGIGYGRNSSPRVAPFLLPIHRHKLQPVEQESGGILRGALLAGLFVLGLMPIRPITDGLDQNPVHFFVLASHIHSPAFHLAANGFRFQAAQLVAEVQVVHQLLAGQDNPKTNRRALPLQYGTLEMVDQPGRGVGFVAPQHQLGLACARADALEVV